MSNTTIPDYDKNITPLRPPKKKKSNWKSRSTPFIPKNNTSILRDVILTTVTWTATPITIHLTLHPSSTTHPPSPIPYHPPSPFRFLDFWVGSVRTASCQVTRVPSSTPLDSFMSLRRCRGWQVATCDWLRWQVGACEGRRMGGWEDDVGIGIICDCTSLCLCGMCIVYTQIYCTRTHTCTEKYIFISIKTCTHWCTHLYACILNVHKDTDTCNTHAYAHMHSVYISHSTPPPLPLLSVVLSGALFGEPGGGVLDLYSNKNGEHISTVEGKEKDELCLLMYV